jgi:hypothetical protein|tara:strand:+ start:255 stop:491 length:237 start_codon:yes stop_codon:yes gene_type:complete
MDVSTIPVTVIVAPIFVLLIDSMWTITVAYRAIGFAMAVIGERKQAAVRDRIVTAVGAGLTQLPMSELYRIKGEGTGG